MFICLISWKQTKSWGKAGKANANQLNYVFRPTVEWEGCGDDMGDNGDRWIDQ